MTDSMFREIRRLQEDLGAVKTCTDCGRNLPIEFFYPPNAKDYRGVQPCKGCHGRQRSSRVCKTPGCGAWAEPKDDYCLRCQLDGKAPNIVTRRGSL